MQLKIPNEPATGSTRSLVTHIFTQEAVVNHLLLHQTKQAAHSLLLGYIQCGSISKPEDMLNTLTKACLHNKEENSTSSRVFTPGTHSNTTNWSPSDNKRTANPSPVSFQFLCQIDVYKQLSLPSASNSHIQVKTIPTAKDYFI